MYGMTPMNFLSLKTQDELRKLAGEFDHMEEEQECFSFIFKGMTVVVDQNDFVRLGNCGFHLEAASPELKAAIEAVRP